MMNLQDTIDRLTILLAGSQTIYVHTEPETLDFTSKEPGKIVVHTAKGLLKFEIDRTNARDITSLLSTLVFNKESVATVLCWDIKSIVTYLRFCVPKFVTITSAVLDLKVIESFRGINKKRPVNLVEAVNRTKVLTKNPIWKPIYRTIHMPLMLRSLPLIETVGLLNEEMRKPVFPYYEVEGQANGRMNCLKRFKHSFLPHNMSMEGKKILKPRGDNMGFLTADYRHCEVTVLQWLSKDEKLKAILDSGQDLHRAIYTEITGDACDNENKRVMSKKIFLPVMYGCGPAGLAHNLGVGDDTANQLIQRIKTGFGTAWNWMIQQQTKAAEQGWLEDLLGRRRAFNEPYKARNFSVQGVAATVCQEKMIVLQRSLNETASVVFSVHDGYGLVVRAGCLRANCNKVREALESESKICPGGSVQSIVNEFPITEPEFNELDEKFGQLCHYAAWQLKKKNSNNNHTDEQEDVAQDLRIALLRAGSYYKRQTYIENCFTVLDETLRDKFVKKLFVALVDLWNNRTRHGANRQKFGEYQEQIMERLLVKYVDKADRPQRTEPLKMDAKFVTYCKQIIWNQQKAIGKKITREKSWRNGLVSLSEYDYLGATAS
ncbi:polA [Symbiodinium microadriaticum]|nr:polA [Symbiodinium microadriaticum]